MLYSGMKSPRLPIPPIVKSIAPSIVCWVKSLLPPSWLAGKTSIVIVPLLFSLTNSAKSLAASLPTETTGSLWPKTISSFSPEPLSLLLSELPLSSVALLSVLSEPVSEEHPTTANTKPTVSKIANKIDNFFRNIQSSSSKLLFCFLFFPLFQPPYAHNSARIAKLFFSIPPLFVLKILTRLSF